MITKQEQTTNTADQVADGALPIDAAVTFSGLSRAELYRRMGRGELAFVKLGKRRLIPRNALRALLAKGMVAAVAE